MPTIAELGKTYSTLDFGDDSWIVVEIDGVTGRIGATDLRASLKEDPLVLQDGAISLGSATGTLASIDAAGAGRFVALTCTTLQAEKLSGQLRLATDAGWGSGGLSFSNTADGSSGGFLARFNGSNIIGFRLPSETASADPGFVVVNAAGSTQVLTLSDAGRLTVSGGISTGGGAVIGSGGLRVVGQVRLSLDGGWGSGGLSFSNTADGSSGGFLARFNGSNIIGFRLPSETASADPGFVVVNAAGSTQVLILSDSGQLSVTNDIEILTASQGIILKSPGGNRYRITVDDSGVLSTSRL